ncbi:MAG: hypothetical protein ACI9H6_000570 [Patiriisocius sp.]|jgi:hypothetical protein
MGEFGLVQGDGVFKKEKAIFIGLDHYMICTPFGHILPLVESTSKAFQVLVGVTNT